MPLLVRADWGLKTQQNRSAHTGPERRECNSVAPPSKLRLTRKAGERVRTRHTELHTMRALQSIEHFATLLGRLVALGSPGLTNSRIAAVRWPIEPVNLRAVWSDLEPSLLTSPKPYTQ